MSKGISELSGDLPKSARLSFYTPLLPYFSAVLIAFIFAGTFKLRLFVDIFLWIGVALIFTEITLRFLKSIFADTEQSQNRWHQIVFLSFRYTGVVLVCMWYFYFRVDVNPYKDFAPRNIEIVACINEVSRGVNDSRYGVAQIVDAPDVLKDAIGYKFWYTISDGKNRRSANKDIIVSQLVKMTGVFACTYPDETKSRGYQSKNFDSRAFEKYLYNRAIYFKMNCCVANVNIVKQADSRFEYIGKVRGYMEDSLSAFWRNNAKDSEASNAYRAMILGDKSLLNDTQKQSYMDTGTMHVFAISGLHIGFAGLVLFGILSALRVNWRIQPLFALPMLYVYVCACGSRPSAIRAFAMVSLVWCALSLSRGIRPFGALVLAGFVSLVVLPTCIFDAGFVLSYSIVASIFIYAVPLFNYISYRFFPRSELDDASKLRRFTRWLILYFVCAFCISLGALFVGAPLSAHYFSFVAPMSIFYSPVFVSGAGVSVGLGFSGFLVPEFIAKCFNEVAVFIVGVMSDFAVWGAKFWSGRIDFSMPSTLLSYIAVLGFLFISAMLSRKRNIVLRFLLAPMFVVLIMVFSLLCVVR